VVGALYSFQALSVILIRPIWQRPQLGGAEAVLFGAVALMRPALIINLRRNAKSFKLIRSRNANITNDGAATISDSEIAHRPDQARSAIVCTLYTYLYLQFARPKGRAFACVLKTVAYSASTRPRGSQLAKPWQIDNAPACTRLRPRRRRDDRGGGRTKPRSMTAMSKEPPHRE
jgi:hypothetical protein